MNVSTGRKLKKLLTVISKEVPFKPNMSTLSQVIGASRNTIADYLLYIEKAGMISQVRNDTGGIRGVGKVEKIYLDNINISYNLSVGNANIGSIRETIFYNQLRVISDVVTSSAADFETKGITFEIGGKNKGRKQIGGIKNAFIIKDDIEYGYMNVIPLWQFGLLY